MTRLTACSFCGANRAPEDGEANRRQCPDSAACRWASLSRISWEAGSSRNARWQLVRASWIRPSFSNAIGCSNRAGDCRVHRNGALELNQGQIRFALLRQRHTGIVQKLLVLRLDLETLAKLLQRLAALPGVGQFDAQIEPGANQPGIQTQRFFVVINGLVAPARLRERPASRFGPSHNPR